MAIFLMLPGDASKTHLSVRARMSFWSTAVTFGSVCPVLAIRTTCKSRHAYKRCVGICISLHQFMAMLTPVPLCHNGQSYGGITEYQGAVSPILHTAQAAVLIAHALATDSSDSCSAY